MKVRLVAVAIALAILWLMSASPRAQETGKSPRSAWEGVYTKDQAKRGEALYAEHCSSCHNADLTGNDEAAPLAGAAFMSNWDGLSIGDLSERVRISMPPNRLGKLTRQQIVDILSYVLSVNGFPPGKTEMDSKLEIQKDIRIEGTKPKTK
jgi:mono/diheme cytochrome c family protein